MSSPIGVNDMDALERRCAWCGKELSPERRVPRLASVSHGICLNCTVREFGVSFEKLEGFGEGELNDLPYGVIALDFAGRILEYNQTESEISHRSRGSVIGRKFFDDVAPCTDVGQFKGMFDELIRMRSGEKSFSFVFGFPGRSVLVKVTLHASRSSEVIYVLIKKITEEFDSPALA